MPDAEDALSFIFPVGRTAKEEFVQARLKLAGMIGVGVCFDYEDFNSQHSTQAMVEVLEAYADVFGPQMHPEQRAAMEWVCLSAVKQSIGGDEPYSTAGTLLSGWRLTTFVNTLLNYIYLEYAGSLRATLDSVHNGDDVLAYCMTVQDAVKMLSRADAAGIRAQASKCVIGGIEEFLRVDRAATEPTGSQYLARAVATAVHSRTEAREPETAYQQYTSQRVRINELAQRGADVDTCATLHRLNASNTTRVFEMEPGVIERLETTHVVHGGLSDDQSIEPCWEVRTAKVRDDVDLSEFESLPGVCDYARYLKNLFRLGDNVEKLARDGLARATHAMVSYTRSRLEFVGISNKRVAKNEQYLHHVCENDIRVKAFTGKARLAGIPVGKIQVSKVSTMAMVRLQNSNDPVRTMRIIF
jgi:hypothetical protein